MAVELELRGLTQTELDEVLKAIKDGEGMWSNVDLYSSSGCGDWTWRGVTYRFEECFEKLVNVTRL